MEYLITSATPVEVVLLDKYKRYYLESFFWGFILSLISLPLYLAGIGIPEMGAQMGIDSFLVFTIPTSAAFLVSVVLSERDMVYSVTSIVSGMVFLIALFFVFMSYPSFTKSAILTDLYYMNALKKLFLVVLLMFPSFFIGGITGKIIGERYISEQTRKERQELNMKMREWKETLERVLQEKLEEEMKELEKRKERENEENRHND